MTFRVPPVLLTGLLLASVAVISQPLAAQDATSPRVSAPPATAPAPRPAAVRAQPAPVGAIWVSTSGSYYRDTPRIDLFIEDLRTKPFGEAIIQVVDGQTAFYDSQILPKATGVPEQFDPLATLVKGLHAAPGKVKLIAWINPYLAGNVNRPTPKAPNHVLAEHPDWLSQRADGTKSDDDGNEYLEPGLPEVQMHLEAMVKELVRKYPVDGIYFDPIGDPGADWGFNPAVVEAWRQSAHGQSDKPSPGDPAWTAFRAEVITQALAGLTRAARETRPGIIVGVGARTDGPAPLTSETISEMKSTAGNAQRYVALLETAYNAFKQSPVYTNYHQNWPAWLGNDAAPVNRLYLKDFKSEGTEKGAFDAWLKFGLLAAPRRGAQVMVGVDGSLNESILAMAQLRKAVESGAGGIALSDYEKPLRDSDAKEPFMTAIRSTVLSPEFLAGIANRNRLRAAVEADAQVATEETTPSLARIAASQPGAAQAPSSGEELRLPPPPAGSAARQTPADLLGATTPQDDTTAGGEVTFKRQHEVQGAEDAATTGSLAAARASAEALTRRQMLDELINDPNFRQSGNLIEPGEKYKAYLKERFGNIFDE